MVVGCKELETLINSFSGGFDLLFYIAFVIVIFATLLFIGYRHGKEKGSEEERRLWVLTFSFLTPSERQFLRERMDIAKEKQLKEELNRISEANLRYMGN